MSSFLPLNANDDVRAFTCNPVIFESAVINSSLTPSLKYSSFLSALMFTNGNTAIDFAAASVRAALALFRDVVSVLFRQRLKASNPAAMTTTPIMKVANFRGLHVGNFAATSGGTFSVRFRPSGVASNAHEINTAMAKPRASSTTSVFITQLGASNVGSKIDAA